MSEHLTDKQQMIYDFVKNEIKCNGYPPSVREICDAVGLNSTSTVHAHLESLQRKGWIKRIPAKNRSIEILEPGFYAAQRSFAPVPIVESFIDGRPDNESINDIYLVPQEYVKKGAYFMYCANNEDKSAMVSIGDMVLVLYGRLNVSETDIILIQSGGDILVTKFPKRKKKFNIIGKVIALFRRY